MSTKPSIARSTASMSLGTALSRLTGFVRTWAMAVALGATLAKTGGIPIASSFNIANNIPNMVYELLVGGIFSSMLIPIFIEAKERLGEKRAFRFINNLFCVSLVLLGVMAVVGTFLPQPFVWTQTFTRSRDEAALAVYLFRFFAVQIVFYGFAAITTGVINSYRRFVATALAPVANNLVVIVVLLGVYMPLRATRPDLALVALGAGTTAGVLAILVCQLPSLLRVGFRFRWVWDLSDPTLRKMARKMIPILVFTATNIVGISFRNAFATKAVLEGSALLAYGWMWYQLPYGVLAVALFTALFPELSEAAGRADWTRYKSILSRGLRVMALLILPMAAMLIALATQLATLYRAGNFSAEAVPMVANIVRFWSLGLFSFSAYMFTLRGFYSMQDSLTPMYTNLVATSTQLALYWGLTSVPSVGLYGIPIADATYITLHLVILLVVLRRRVGPFDGRAVAWTVGRMALASAAGGGAAFGIVLLAAPRLGAGGLASILTLLAGGVVGLGVAYGAAALMRVDEIHDGAAMLRRFAGRLLPSKAAA